MAYSGIGFVNDNPPAINAENLNKMDNELVFLDKGKKDTDYIIYPKNMIGNVANVYYPIAPLKSNDIITISTSNGAAPDQDYIFSFYDINKTLLGQSKFKTTDGSSKTYDLANAWSAIVGTAFIKLNIAGTNPFQCELGPSATEYEVYRPNELVYHDKINELNEKVDINEANFEYVSYRKNLVGNDIYTYYPIIPLKSSDFLTFSTQSGQAVSTNHIFDFYDKNKTLLGSVRFRTTDGPYRTIDIENTFSGLLGACYIKPQQVADDPIQIELGQVKTQYEEYYPNGLYIAENAINKKYNKTWMVIGDSLTDPTTLGADKIYADYVANNLGLTVINKGVGGTGYWRGTDVNKAFYQRIASFTEAAPDIITFFGSFNDLGTDSRGIDGSDIIGTATDSTSETIGGCINLTLNAIIQYAPDALLGIMAPTEWQGYYHNSETQQYVKLLKDIAEYRGIPFLDLYTASNLRPNESVFRNTYYLNADGTHPNTLGHKRFSGLVEQFIKSLCYV